MSCDVFVSEIKAVCDRHEVNADEILQRLEIPLRNIEIWKKYREYRKHWSRDNAIKQLCEDYPLGYKSIEHIITNYKGFHE